MTIQINKLNVSRERGRNKRIISGIGSGATSGGGGILGGGINIPGLPDAADFDNMYMVIDKKGSETPVKTPFFEWLRASTFNSMFELMPNDGNPFIRAKYNFVSDGEVMAYADSGQLPASIWDSMPIATPTSLGGVKIGSGLTINANGLLSVDGELGGVSSWNDLASKPAWLAPTTQAAFEAAHDHTKLNGYAATEYPRKAESARITGLWRFDVTVGSVPFIVPAAKNGRVINLNADLLDGYHASSFPRKSESAIITGSWKYTAQLKYCKIGSGSQYVNSDPRWSGDLARLHWAASKADGTTWGDAGLALYNGASGGGYIYIDSTSSGIAISKYLSVNKSSAASEALDVNGNGKFTSDAGVAITATSPYWLSQLKLSRNGYDAYLGVGADGALALFSHSKSSGAYVKDGMLGIGKIPTQALDVNGNILASGEVTAYSDIRLKSNFKIIRNPLARSHKLKGCTYDKDGQRRAGLIAQHVQKVLPEAVHGSVTTTTYLSINNMGVTGLLVEGIKAVDRKTESNRERIERLENQNKQLLTKIKQQNETIERLAANAGGLDGMRKGA